MSSPVSIVWWRKMFTRYGQVVLVLLTLLLVIGFGWNQFGGARGGAGPQTNPDRTIMRVNGQPITQQQLTQIAKNMRQSTPGTQFASSEGQALMQLVEGAVIAQLAKQHGVKADPAEIDRSLDQLAKQFGMKDASDPNFESELQQRTGMSLSDARQQLADNPQILIPSLLQNYKAAQHVTDQDVRNQNQQVNLDVVLIPIGNSPFMPAKKGQKPLTDAEAKAKAEALLAQARGGADIKAIARANSSDIRTSRQGGETRLQPEYGPGMQMGMQATMGSLGYGKDFDEAVHKTPVGKFTDVVKAAGFQPGYLFAKVLDRHENTPKNFDARKALDDLKTQRAQQQLMTDIQDRMKTANVQFTDLDDKAYYDYVKLTQMPMEIQMQQMTHQAGNAPTMADYQKQQAVVDTEFEDMLKRHPDDSTAALIVAEAVGRKMYQPGTTPAQRTAYHDQLIDLYTKALRSIEDRDIRFKLADEYKQKKDFAKADEQYQKISKYLGESPPYDLNSYQEYKGYYTQLQTGFSSIDQPKEAADMAQKIKDLSAKIAIEQAKEAKQQAASKAAQPPVKSVTLPSGGVKTVSPTASKTAPTPGR